jgi:hypothetical protein
MILAAVQIEVTETMINITDKNFTLNTLTSFDKKNSFLVAFSDLSASGGFIF